MPDSKAVLAQAGDHRIVHDRRCGRRGVRAETRARLDPKFAILLEDQDQHATVTNGLAQAPVSHEARGIIGEILTGGVECGRRQGHDSHFGVVFLADLGEPLGKLGLGHGRNHFRVVGDGGFGAGGIGLRRNEAREQQESSNEEAEKAII